MTNKISLIIGQESAGWITVELKHQNFIIREHVSLILNDPIDEIYNLIIDFAREKKVRQTGSFIFWLEPLFYTFNFEKESDSYTLTIDESPDFGSPKKKTIQVIKGNYKQIIFPFKKAIIDLANQPEENKYWPSELDRIKVQSLTLYE